MERVGVVNQRQMVSTYLVLESKQVPPWYEIVFDPVSGEMTMPLICRMIGCAIFDHAWNLCSLRI